MDLATLPDFVTDDKYEVINGRLVVKKHVATIHCSNKLSLLERKISNALLFHAFPNLKSQLIHEVTIDELKRLIGANTRNHKALKEALKKLISTVLEWNLLEDALDVDLEGWNLSAILSSVSVSKGVIKYQYSELLKSLISDPSIYGKINLAIQSRFKSSYALALYENCSRYRGLHYTKNFDMPLFRKLMGVEEGKYEIFRDFNRRVLTPAVTEINTCSDIRITPELSRFGRSIKSIKFKLEERPMKRRIGIVQPEKKPKARPLPEIDIPAETLAQFIARYGQEKVEKGIIYVKSKLAYKEGSIKNVVGYLKTSIENDYQDTPIMKEKKSSELTQAQKEKILWRQHQHDYFLYIRDAIATVFLALSHEKQSQLLDAFFVEGKSIVVNYLREECFLLKAFEGLGASLEGVCSGIKTKDQAALLFFEKGYTEYLYKKLNDAEKEILVSFQAYIKKEKAACLV